VQGWPHRQGDSARRKVAAAATTTSVSGSAAAAQTGMQGGAVSVPCTVSVSIPELAMPTNSASMPLLQAGTGKTEATAGKTANAAATVQLPLLQAATGKTEATATVQLPLLQAATATGKTEATGGETAALQVRVLARQG